MKAGSLSRVKQVSFGVRGCFFVAGSTCRCWDLSKIADDGAVRVEWYIQVDGDVELYALSTAYLNQSFDKQGRPYGLVITQTGSSYTEDGKGVVGLDWFNYPCENTPISEV